jgi:DNA-binding ferritin-like protein
MKKFSDFKRPLKKINEDQDMMTGMPKANLPEGSEENSGEKAEDKKEESKETGSVSKFISKLLESREMAQVYHWTVKGDMGSHAAHLALEAYYSGVIEFIDDIVEIYQGQYGLIEGYDIIDTTDSKSKDRLDYFKEAVEFVKSNRSCIKAEDTHIHNIVDEVVALLYRTIYKLTYNK